MKLKVFADNWFADHRGIKGLNALLIHPWVLVIGMIPLFAGFVAMKLVEAALRKLGLGSSALSVGFFVGSYVVGRIIVYILPGSGRLWER